TLTVSDGALSDNEIFTISVTPVNDAPSITSTAGTMATEDVQYSYTASVSDSDDSNNGVDLTWSLTNAPTGMTVSSVGVVQWTPTEGILSSGAVTLTVSDGALSDNEIFTISVTSVNDAPSITSTAGTMATEDVQYSYAASVSDSDDSNNGVDLTWSLTNAPTGMTVSSVGVVQWTPTEGILSSGAVTLTVSDGALSDNEIFTISVTPVNDAPSITSTAGTMATEDVQYSYTASVSDSDDSNNGVDLTWSLTNAPTGMTVSSVGVVQWTPNEGILSSGTVTLTVSDGALSDNEIFTISVTPVNDAPSITSSAGTTAIEDIQYSYAASVSDSDDSNNGVDLTWSLTNAPT
ncbi:putative Ig domain-containing protein, partial [Litorilituus lipolyticus]|uniref:putative Ig domain-containing protein n=1 Tax=Litorilituus lipolyticus TaxID=2491017 RepID=UPI001FE47B84